MTASCCRSRQRPSIPASPLACVNRDWVHSSARLRLMVDTAASSDA
jgi:hypothetical protein